MNVNLPIVNENNKIFLYYYKANHYLLSNNLLETVDIDLLWKKHFDASIDYKNKLIKFKSERDKTLFLLKWG